MNSPKPPRRRLRWSAARRKEKPSSFSTLPSRRLWCATPSMCWAKRPLRRKLKRLLKRWRRRCRPMCRAIDWNKKSSLKWFLRINRSTFRAWGSSPDWKPPSIWKSKGRHTICRPTPVTSTLWPLRQCRLQKKWLKRWWKWQEKSHER